MYDCYICGKKLQPGEAASACMGCLRPRDEREQEIKDLAEANKVLYEALEAIDRLRLDFSYRLGVPDGVPCRIEGGRKSSDSDAMTAYRQMKAALASVKVTP